MLGGGPDEGGREQHLGDDGGELRGVGRGDGWVCLQDGTLERKEEVLPRTAQPFPAKKPRGVGGPLPLRHETSPSEWPLSG